MELSMVFNRRYGYRGKIGHISKEPTICSVDEREVVYST
jgi:hypothetical protein